MEPLDLDQDEPVVLPPDVEAEEQQRPAQVVYRIDSRKLKFGEIRRLKPGMRGIIIGLLKPFNPGLKLQAHPNVEWLTPFEVVENDIPRIIREKVFKPRIDQLTAMGFGDAVYYKIADAMNSSQRFWVALRHSSGSAIARVQVLVWRLRTPPVVMAATYLITERTDGTFLITVNRNDCLESPAAFDVKSMPKASEAELWTEHQRRSAARGEGGTARGIRYMASADEMVEVAEHHHAVIRDYYLDRRLFVPLNAREAALHESAKEIHRQAEDSGTGALTASVAAEIEKIQNQSNGRVMAVFAAVVISLVDYLRSRQGGLYAGELGAILLGVYAFLEICRIIAMRAVGYRNVRVILLPGIGGMVTGKSYNVSGGRKTIAALMGPIPGVAASVIIGSVGMAMNNELLIKIGLVAAFYNAIMLLPFLPFPGGVSLQNLICARHWVLEGLFRSSAGAVLILWGFAGQSRLLTVVGALLVLAAWSSTRKLKIALELKQQGISPQSPDDQSIPPATIAAIVQRLQKGRKKRMLLRQLATRTLGVFEAINTTPPAWGATVGLGALHVGALAVAVGFGSVLLVKEYPAMGTLSRLRALEPTGVVAMDSVKIVKGANAPAAGSPVTIVVGTFRSVDAARSEFDSLDGRTLANVSRELFGQSVLLCMAGDDDEARVRWLGELKGKARSAMVILPDSLGQLNLQCEAVSEADAAAINEEFNDYVMLGAAHLIPPWQKPDARSSEEIAANRRARRTYQRLFNAARDVISDAKYRQLVKDWLEAAKDGDRAAMRRIEAEQKSLEDAATQKVLRELKDDQSGEVDQEMVRLYEAKAATRPAAAEMNPEADRAVLTPEMEARMGQLEMSDGKPVPAADELTAEAGYGRAIGKRVLLDAYGIRDEFNFLPAIVVWLNAKGTGHFKYEIHTPIRPSDLENGQ